MKAKIEKPLSQAAKNEGIKLKASFCNNMAVALYAGGIFIPVFTLLQHFIEEHQVAPNAFTVSTADFLPLGSFSIVVLLSLLLAQSFRFKAVALIQTLE